MGEGAQGRPGHQPVAPNLFGFTTMNDRFGMTRRRFNQAAVATLVSATLPTGCTSRNDAPSYDDLVADTWRHSDGRPDSCFELQKELIRYATLAPNSHNTQPWQFRVERDRIVILPDYSRRCPAVDPDDHHVFVTLGCAAENLALAAAAFGLHAEVTIGNSADAAILVDLHPDTPDRSDLFQAIPDRQSTRAGYDGKPVPSDQLATLERAAQSDSVAVQLMTKKRELEDVLEFVVAGNTAQMADDAFVKELEEWIRFNETSAVERRDGLFTASSGNPTSPSWLGNIVFNFAFRTSSENDKYRDHIRSSAGVIAFVSDIESKEGWINVGRSFQRFALRATALGLRHAHINQAVEVPEVRRQFSGYLGIGDKRPDLLVRFGYGPKLPQSLRRPVEDVLA